MKTLSLLKAVLSQDMNIFKYQTGKNASLLKKIIFPIILFVIVCISIGTYAYMIAKNLAPLHLTYIMLSMFIAIVTVITFIEGIYKSQGILFEAKDNDLLFSLPIAKSKILFIRIFKLLIFQYIYNLMFLLPAFIIYIYFEKPTINFYLISLIMTLLIPIIPTTISSTLGYLIKLLSSKFKAKKIVQTLLSSFFFLGIFFLSMNIEDFIKNIASQALNINDFLIKIYYPIGSYINLIQQFDFITFCKLLLINIIPFGLFILLGSKYYFKIIFHSKENSLVKNNKNLDYTKRRPIYSLVKKELKRYFSSPVYMFNTSFGLLLILVVTILICIKGRIVFEDILANYNVSTNISLSTLYYFLILFSTSMTSITSSCISLEGRTINLTKSLPVSEITILKSKVIYPYFIELPFLIISQTIYFIKFKPTIFYMVSILLIGIVMIFISSVTGLIINLKYPKMNASNDTEVVKQSMSSMVSVFIGMAIFIISILGFVFLSKKIDINLLIIIHINLFIIISIILYIILIKIGTKEYQKINV